MRLSTIALFLVGLLAFSSSRSNQGRRYLKQPGPESGDDPREDGAPDGTPLEHYAERLTASPRCIGRILAPWTQLSEANVSRYRGALSVAFTVPPIARAKGARAGPAVQLELTEGLRLVHRPSGGRADLRIQCAGGGGNLPLLGAHLVGPHADE